MSSHKIDIIVYYTLICSVRSKYSSTKTEEEKEKNWTEIKKTRQIYRKYRIHNNYYYISNPSKLRNIWEMIRSQISNSLTMRDFVS